MVTEIIETECMAVHESKVYSDGKTGLHIKVPRGYITRIGNAGVLVLPDRVVITTMNRFGRDYQDFFGSVRRLNRIYGNHETADRKIGLTEKCFLKRGDLVEIYVLKGGKTIVAMKKTMVKGMKPVNTIQEKEELKEVVLVGDRREPIITPDGIRITPTETGVHIEFEKTWEELFRIVLKDYTALLKKATFMELIGETKKDEFEEFLGSD